MDGRSTEDRASPRLPADADDPSEALRRAERLFEINVQLSATRDPDALLRYIIETAADVLHCEAASVLLYREDEEELRFAAATGSDVEELAKVPVPLDDSLAGTVFTKNEPLVVGDVAADARHYEPAAEQVAFEARSLMGVPLRLDGRPIGVLEGLNKTDGAFTDEDVRTLSVLAAQAAVAIRNATQMQALEEANEQLSRLDELKSDFLALASHELRTPLSTVLGFSEVIQEQAEGGDLAEPASMVNDAAGRMKEVIETMGRMETLRSNAAELDTRRVALGPVLRRACNDASLQGPGGRDRLALELPEGELVVDGEPERLGLIFSNLVENAFQFSPDGGPVEVRAMRENGMLHVTVRDEGVGLSAEETERIFEDFYQAEDTLTRTHGGLGLGLTMARELARQHDGRLRAESAGQGQGTTMHLHLPLAS
jgi:signal transduction histidine kinase